MDRNLTIAEEVVKGVGGGKNIRNVFHCATRLRFELADNSLVDEDALKKIPGVMGVANRGGMYQVIIGQNVEAVCEHVCKLIDLKPGATIEENLDPSIEKKPKNALKKVGNSIFSYLVATMAPVIPLILGAGLWMSVASILGPSVLNILPADGPLAISCDLVYDAAFYFLPLYVGYSAAKALNISNPVWGILVGALTIVPDFVSMVGSAETFSLFGLVSVPVAGYGSTVLPSLLGVWIFSYLYKGLKKIIPEVIFGAIAPFIILFVMAILMLLVFAPLGTLVGNALSSVFMWMYNSALPIRIIGYILLTALWPVITLCGMHLPIFMTALAIMLQTGYDAFAIVCASTSVWVTYGMAFGGIIKFRKKEHKTAAMSAFIAGVIGAICEPAIYGVALKSKSATATMLVAGGISGLALSILQPTYNVLSSGNFLGLFASWAGSSANLIKGMGCMLFAFALGALGTIFFARFDEDTF